MKKNLIALLIILLVSCALSLPLLKPGLFQMHDDQHVARLFLFDEALKSGQFPLRWVNDLGFGFGYPLFNFYPPLVYAIGETFHLVGFGFITSVKLVFFLSIFASGIAMYILVKELWGRTAGLVSAFFYMLVPYRALDVYVRGALAESFAFVWLPLILWSFFKLSKTHDKVYLILSAFFLSFLMITHNLIFLPFMLILPFYLLFLILTSSDRKKSVVNCLSSIVHAFGLSAFFWLPALLEKKFTLVDSLLLSNLADYRIHFVYPQQLWNWTWGFGGSAEGLADGISFKIGKLHILTSVAALIISVIIWIKKSRFKLSVVSSKLSVVFFVLFAFSAFMTTYFSKFIWDLIPQLAYLQFSWRFLIFTALFSSILAGAFIYFLKLPILRLKVALILVLLLFIFNLKLFNPQTYRFGLTDEIATSREVINWDVSQTSFEYAPKGFPLTKNNLGVNVADLKKEETSRDLVSFDPQILSIQNISSTPSKINFNLDAKEEGSITINRFYFPGWQAKVDGSSLDIKNDNKFKLMELIVPQGKHQISVEFKNTPVRTIANALSLFSIFSLILFYFRKWPRILAK